MKALTFIISTLVGLYQLVVLMRLLMQVNRADFRNPIGRAIMQLTDPIILPLRRLLPPLGRIDSASVVAVLLVTVAKIWVLHLLGAGMQAPLWLYSLVPHWLAADVLFDTIDLVLRTYLYSLFLLAILSFVAAANYSPAQSILASICNPVLNPIRRRIPAIGGLDLSPMWAMIAIQALLILLSSR